MTYFHATEINAILSSLYQLTFMVLKINYCYHCSGPGIGVGNNEMEVGGGGVINFFQGGGW